MSDAEAPTAPLPARVAGGLAVLVNGAAVAWLFLNATTLVEDYERAVLVVLFLLEGFGVLGLYGGVLLHQGRRLGLWLVLAAHPLQTLLAVFVGFPALRAWLPLAVAALIVLAVVPVWKRLR